MDATIDLGPEDQLIMTQVRQPHLRWEAQRAEPRQVPDPFPPEDASVGQGDAPFPPMPSAQLEVSWWRGQDTRVWVVLSTSACGLRRDANPAAR